MLKRLAFALIAILLGAAPALAQSVPVYQSGTISTPHAVAKYWSNGLIGDAASAGVLGDANGRGVKPFAVEDGLDLGLCSNSAATGGEFNALCLGHDSSGNGLITLDSYGGLAEKELFIRIGGVLFPFPGTGNGDVVGPTGSTANALAAFSGTSGKLLLDSGLTFASGTLGYGTGGYTGTALLGPNGSNPYSALYYDVQPLAKNSLFTSDGTLTIFNRYGYGDLETGTAGNFTVNSFRPGCVNGYTNPNQVALLPELGSVALCSQADTIPSMGTVGGTFTATTFVPTSPIQPTASLFIKRGMWLRSSDSVPFAGQVTSFATNGSGQITSITVSQWFQEGGGGAAGTPSGANVYLNPQDHVWASLPAVYLGTFSLSGTTTSGSTLVASVAGLGTRVAKYQRISGTGIPAGTVIADFDPVANSITLSQQATASGGATLSISAGPGNRSAAAEVDVYNNAQAAAPVVLSATGTTASGNRTITSLSVNPQTNNINPGMVVYGTGVPGGAVIRATTSSSITLNMPATASGSGVPLKIFNMFDDGGVGLDIYGAANNAATAIALRGNLYYGVNCLGAVDTCYLMQPNGFAALPAYGFRVDGNITGHATSYDFAITNGATLKWGVTGGGGQITTGVTSSTAGATPQVVATDPAGTYRQVNFQTNGTPRFLAGINDIAEGGGNTGSNFVIIRSNDAGAAIDTPLQINRASGNTTLTTLTVNALPGSAGGSGLYVCVDGTGVFYRKASCP